MSALTPAQERAALDPPVEAIVLHWPAPELNDARWRMLAASILGQHGAGREEMDNVWPGFFEEWGTPRDCLRASIDGIMSVDDMIAHCAPLPRSREKVSTIRRLSRVWTEGRRPPEVGVEALPGCGAREAEAWMLLVDCSVHPEYLQNEELASWAQLRVDAGGWDAGVERAVILNAVARRLRDGGYRSVEETERAEAP